MQNRYRFDLEGRYKVFRDVVGVMADDFNQANEEAAAVIQEMRDSGELPELDEEWDLVIRDENGTELKRIAL